MNRLPSVANSFFRLRRAGWNASDSTFHCPNGNLVWFVCAHKEGNRVNQGGLSQEEAWHEAAQEAEIVDWG